MPLTFTITSYQRLSPSQEATKVINRGCVTIGRAPENDWVLPDPERFLSGRHCIIEYRDGAYFITDTSTNGVFINHAEERLGRGKTAKLNNGDHLALGDYEIEVTIDQPDKDIDITSANQPFADILAAADPLAGQSSTASSIADASRSDPFNPPSEGESFQPPNAVEDLLAEDGDAMGLSDEQASPEHASLAPANQVKSDAQATPSETDRRAIQAFLAGAGMEQLQIPDAEVTEFMMNVGEVFRQMVQGIMEVLMARSRIKNEFRLSQTMIRPVENNPLKFSVGVDDAIAHLLTKQGKAYLPAKQAVSEGFNDIKAHQLAVIVGMQAALNHLLKRFDPKRLEKRLGQQSSLDNILFRSRKAKYWDLFSALYEEIVREAEDDFQELFGKEFARAYEEQVRKH